MTPRRFTNEEADYLEAAGFTVGVNGVAGLIISERVYRFIMQNGETPGFIASVSKGRGRPEYLSPVFDDPISAFVYAELNNWGSHERI